VSQRDRLILAGAAVIALVGAFWLLALAPKRRDLDKLDKDVQASEQSYQTARADAQGLAEARLQFPSAYASLVRLGKAVPTSADVPSLVVQLDQAASSAGVDFRTISLNTTAVGSAPAPPPAASATPPASSSSSGTTGTSGAQGSTSSTSTGTTGSTGTTDANALTAATLPIGATVGPAGLPTLRFNFSFQGSFFKMANLMHNIRKLVARRNRNLIVSGRLLTIDGISLSEGDFGFPKVKASIAATAYLVPASQGLLDGATAQGPDGASGAGATPASATTGSTTPPAAVVTAP
jgi:hypothetical protein